MAEDIKTIRVSVNGYPGIEMEGRVSAGQTIYPGYLIALGANGEYYPHTLENGEERPIMVAIENRLLGKTITDPYTQDDSVIFVVARPGDVMLMIPSENVTIGDYLAPDGGGDMGKVHVNNDKQIGMALETVNSGEFLKVLIG